MTEQEFEKAIDNGELDDQYCDYIMERHSVGNGEILIRIIEQGTYYESFKESMVTQ